MGRRGKSLSVKIIASERASAIGAMTWRSLPEGRARALAARGPADDGGLEELRAALVQQAEGAHEQGFGEGLASARQEFEIHLKPLLDGIATQLRDLSASRVRLQREAEESLIHLSISIAKRILNRELTLDPNAIQGIIEVSLAKLRSQQITRVRVHPKLEAALKEALKAGGVNTSEIEVAADAKVGLNGLIVETERGNLDASIDSQLDEIGRGLADGIGR